MNNILFVTLYFSEFFVKYDEIIKKDKNVFNEKEKFFVSENNHMLMDIIDLKI